MLSYSRRIDKPSLATRQHQLTYIGMDLDNVDVAEELRREDQDRLEGNTTRKEQFISTLESYKVCGSASTVLRVLIATLQVGTNILDDRFEQILSAEEIAMRNFMRVCPKLRIAVDLRHGVTCGCRMLCVICPRRARKPSVSVQMWAERFDDVAV